MELTIYNQDLAIKFQNKELNKATQKIIRIAGRIHKNLYEVAATLSDVADRELYKEDGFSSAIDYAEKIFKIKKTAAYTMIAIGRQYTDKDKMESNLPHEEGHDFSATQIERMLPIGEHKEVYGYVEDGTITPDMSCSEISKVVKTLKKKEIEQDCVIENEVEREQEEENVEDTVDKIDEYEKAQYEVDKAINTLFNIAGEERKKEVYDFINDVMNKLL